jgi:hypothetical protein
MVFGGRTIGVVPLVDRQRMVVRAYTDDIVQLFSELHRPLARRDGVVQPIGEVILVGEPLQQLRLVVRRQRTAMIKGDPIELGGGLHNSPAIPGADRMMGYDCRIIARRCVVGVDHATVQSRLCP